MLSQLGNPQDKLSVIHLVGTSGKGSTAYLISQLLQSQGFKVGLNVKPHIIDIRERCQINGKFITKEEFCKYVNKIITAAEKIKNTLVGHPSYFEMTVAIAYMAFVDHDVDYAIIETGMGGQYDATNLVHNPNKLVVLTRIGFDHTQFLGNTLSKIALTKAKAIQKNNHVISIKQHYRVKRIISSVSYQEDAAVEFVETPKNNESLFSEIPSLYQKENAKLALTAVSYLSKRDSFQLDMDKIKTVFSAFQFPGRIERMTIKGKNIIVDGAHNPQKMRALIKDLKHFYPVKKFTFLIGFKSGKDTSQMIKIMLPVAKKIIATDFYTDRQDWPVKSVTIENLGAILNKYGFTNFEKVHDPERALELFIRELKTDGVITGSLYLIGEIYRQLKK